MSTTRNSRRTLRGIVTSDKMDKTITVRVERKYRHPKYGKYIRSHDKYHAHDEASVAKAGDTVDLAEMRPLSKLKRWRLVEVVETALLPEGTAHVDTTTLQEQAAAAAAAAAEDQQ